MQCWAWENLRSSSSFVVVLQKDPTTGATIKKKGATTVHNGPNHFDDALAATQKNYDEAIKLGWRAQKRGYAARQSPTGRVPGRTPNQYPGASGFGGASGVSGAQSSPGSAYAPPRPSSSPFSSPYTPPQQRYTPPPAAAPATPPVGGVSEFPDVDSAARAIVKEGFRQLAMKHHPDKGGTHATMAVLTETKHQLMQMLDLIKD